MHLTRNKHLHTCTIPYVQIKITEPMQYGSYATAIRDPKRRQGFLRTLIDFQTTYNGIQKKHMLLNHHGIHQSSSSRRKVHHKNDTKFPLILSSGPRQNYTRGSGDEGILAFRTMDDVKSFVCHLVGGNAANAWFDGCIEDTTSSSSRDSSGKCRKKKKIGSDVPVISAAERALARASDRVFGVVTCDSMQNSSIQGGNSSNQKRKWSSSLSYYAVGTKETKGKVTVNHDDDDSDDEDEDDLKIETSNSLIDWLSSKPLQNKKGIISMENNDDADGSTAMMSTVIDDEQKEDSIKKEEEKEDDVVRKTFQGGNATIRKLLLQGGGASREARGKKDEGKNDHDSRESKKEDDVEEEDLEDGFIAL